VEYRASEGDAADEILRMCGVAGCDLIVLGTHGRTGLRRILAGSVATAVVRGAPCPVLALRSRSGQKAAGQIQVILHPTDFSGVAETAGRFARSLARDLGARLIVLHVLPFSQLALPVDARGEREALDQLRTKLEGPDLKCPVETQLSRGDAAEEIVRIAGEIGCDLIVMGTHGRTGLRRLLLGNVAESVLPEAGCAVMVVKTPEGEAESHADRPAARGVTII
jgi:nucleotide-binding universal stress UspA family protein